MSTSVLARTQATVANDPNIDPRELADALEALYEAFGYRRLSDPFFHCPCCASDEGIAYWHDLAARPRTLSEDEIVDITNDIATIAGSRDDVLLFTPRILEIASDPAASVDLERLYSKLLDDDAPRTTPQESAALQDFFELHWLALRSNPQHRGSLGVDEILLPTAALTRDPERYLDLVADSSAIELIGRSVNSPFWKPCESARVIEAWFATRARRGH